MKLELVHCIRCDKMVNRKRYYPKWQGCSTCYKRINNRKNVAANPEKHLEARRKYMRENWDRILKKKREYTKERRKRDKEYVMRIRAQHRASYHLKIKDKEWAAKRRKLERDRVRKKYQTDLKWRAWKRAYVKKQIAKKRKDPVWLAKLNARRRANFQKRAKDPVWLAAYRTKHRLAQKKNRLKKKHAASIARG